MAFYGPAELLAVNCHWIRQTLIGVHAELHADRMADDDFRQKFPWFVDHWGGNPGFSCVIAYDGADVVGFAYGAPGAGGREWWRGGRR